MRRRQAGQCYKLGSGIRTSDVSVMRRANRLFEIIQILRSGYDLPPIMFNEQELEALALGIQIDESWTDPKLEKSAGDLIAKIKADILERLGQHMTETALLAPGGTRVPQSADDLL
jgi:predicted DNA-binding transcriptional regulator YafY